jgi:L-histidine N-alpha-methyltransferase
MDNTSVRLSDFAKDVRDGLQQQPKTLSSKYFYNAIGDMLFQKIMELDEYYLTRSEFEILEEQKEAILEAFLGQDESFRLVELGAGDGTKTKLLLKHFVKEKVNFAYSPIDISQHVLDNLADDLKRQLPSLRVEPIQGEYFAALETLKRNHDLKEVVLFLGSTIGNFDHEGGMSFLERLGDELTQGDLLFIGFDLQKDPHIILDAYNDRQGITAAFNLNLLDRINNELGGNFDRDAFKHYPTYDPISGETKSYLISKVAQSVYIEALDEVFDFAPDEPIFMEISQKYSLQMIEDCAVKAGFKMIKKFFDRKKFFVDVLWEKA